MFANIELSVIKQFRGSGGKSMFWQSLTDIQKYAVIGVLVMAITVFALPLLLIFLDKRGINTHQTKPQKLNRHQRRQKKQKTKKRNLKKG